MGKARSDHRQKTPCCCSPLDCPPSPVAVGRARPASALTCRTTRSGRCSRLLMLTPDGSDTAPQISDAARASLRLPAGSPYMNAATTPTAEEELQTLLDAPLFDPWSETPDECSIDTPSGCLPGLERFKQMVREDYYMAEALWAGVFCSVMVTVAMQMVKAYIVATLPAPPPFPM